MLTLITVVASSGTSRCADATLKGFVRYTLARTTRMPFYLNKSYITRLRGVKYWELKLDVFLRRF